MSARWMRLHQGPRREFDFRGQEFKNRHMSSLAYLAAVNVVIWAGLFLYLWRLDRRVAAREKDR
jgi:CcmD family protein